MKNIYHKANTEFANLLGAKDKCMSKIINRIVVLLETHRKKENY